MGLDITNSYKSHAGIWWDEWEDEKSNSFPGLLRNVLAHTVNIQCIYLFTCCIPYTVCTYDSRTKLYVYTHTHNHIRNTFVSCNICTCIYLYSYVYIYIYICTWSVQTHMNEFDASPIHLYFNFTYRQPLPPWKSQPFRKVHLIGNTTPRSYVLNGAGSIRLTQNWVAFFLVGDTTKCMVIYTSSIEQILYFDTCN